MTAPDRTPAPTVGRRQASRSLFDVIGPPDEVMARRFVAVWLQACAAAETTQRKAGGSEAA